MRLSNLKGITASGGSFWLVPQLTAFHQSKTKKSLAVHSCTFVVNITHNKNVGYVVNYTLLRPVVGERQPIVIQLYVVKVDSKQITLDNNLEGRRQTYRLAHTNAYTNYIHTFHMKLYIIGIYMHTRMRLTHICTCILFLDMYIPTRSGKGHF